VLFSALAIGATGVFGRTVTPDREPNTPPTVEPSVPPTAPPTQVPSEPPGDGFFEVDLDNLTDHDVELRVDDETGALVEAESGTPGDGMSVRWFDAKVENVDDDTLRVVWVGLARDEIVHLGVSRIDGELVLGFIQQAPPPNSDATGFDRIVELSFSVPVRAEDVTVSFDQAIPA